MPARHALATVSGALNAVLVEGEALGPCVLSGYGAGGLPTAVSVVSDVIDVVRNLRAGSAGRGRPHGALLPLVAQPIASVESRYFLRMTVRDRAGVLARIAGALGAHEVSIEQMVQEGRGAEEPVQLVMLDAHGPRERRARGAPRD